MLQLLFLFEISFKQQKRRCDINKPESTRTAGTCSGVNNHIFVAVCRVAQCTAHSQVGVDRRDLTSHFQRHINSNRQAKQHLRVVIFANVVAIFTNFPRKSVPNEQPYRETTE